MFFLKLKKYKSLFTFLSMYIGVTILFIIVLGGINIHYMYLILTLINNFITFFGFVTSNVVLTNDEDTIYKDLSKIFGVVGFANLLFSLYIFSHMNQMTLNQEVQSSLLNFFIQILLYISFINTYSKPKKPIIEFNIAWKLIFVFILVQYILIYATDLVMPIYKDGKYHILKNILCILFILLHIHLIFRERNLKGKFYDDKIVFNMQFISICRIGMIMILLVFGGMNFYNAKLGSRLGSTFSCIALTVLNFLYVYTACTICFRDIVRRPNESLYYDLIEEKKKLQENLNKLEELSVNLEYYKNVYETLFVNMPNGIVISSKGKILFVNKKLLKLFNLEKEDELINKDVLDIISEESKSEYTRTKDIVKNTVNLRFSYNSVSFQGEVVRYFEVVNNKKFRVSIINNIEDRIKLDNIEHELELRDIKDQVRDEVLSNISHEFKTPVNVIYSTVQIQDLNLRSENYDKILEFNDIIKKNCNRLIRLINNFIDSTKLDNNNVNLNLKYVNIVAIVEDITMSIVNFANKEGIDVLFDTDEEEIYCEIDVDSIERIMLNLLSNAIKYNKKHGNIIVYVKDREDKVSIEVKDSGIGIPKEKIDTIFDRFARFENNNAVLNKGTGIGLNIVKKLVEALNGDIKIESILNEGTTIRVILNKAENQNGQADNIEIDVSDKVKLELSDIN